MGQPRLQGGLTAPIRTGKNHAYPVDRNSCSRRRFVGAAVPAVSDFVRSVATSVGLPQFPLSFGVSPDAKPPTAPAVKVTDGRAAHDAHDEKRAGAHSQGEAEEGHVKMTAEQIATQNITIERVAGGTIYRHILVPGTITPDSDRVAKVPARVVGTWRRCESASATASKRETLLPCSTAARSRMPRASTSLPP
jgi:cobalt-zinc-cadmium efflux system membrane fusion protein